MSGPPERKFRKRRGDVEKPPAPSRLTIPKHCAPPVKLVFSLMRERRVTYDQLEIKSGVLRTTLKAARVRNLPTYQSLSAWLGALDHELVAVPTVASLPTDLRADLDALAERHGQTLTTLAAWVIESKAFTMALSADGAERIKRWRAREGEIRLAKSAPGRPAGDFLSSREAAVHAGLSPGLLAKLRATGRGPAFIKTGRCIFYRSDDVESWVNAGRIVPSGDPQPYKPARREILSSPAAGVGLTRRPLTAPKSN